MNCMKNLLNQYLLKLFLVLLWLSLLINTDSYYFIYVILAIVSILNNKINVNSFSKNQHILTLIFSTVLSSCVTFANYDIFLSYNSKIVGLVFFFIIYVAGIVVFQDILRFVYYTFNKKKNSDFHIFKYKKVFIITFIVIVLIDLFVLFISEYPGELSIDSIIQMEQIESGIYSNHHPFWHTLLINEFYNLGYNIFKNVNDGVATYSVFQIVSMALIIAYANMTLCQLKTKKVFNIIFCLYFVLIPFNVIYSFTMWKDILFAGMVLLFITCLVRIFENLSNQILTYILLAISTLGFGLLRTNGFYALLFTVFVFSILFFKKYYTSAYLMIVFLVIASIMRGPLLNKINVTQPDLIESLSIPSQQIARVIYDGNEIPPDYEELLNMIVDVDKIETTYLKYKSDSIKDLVREKNNQGYLKDNISDYFMLYIKLGFKYPLEYLKAYIDQTKGYYNGGYDFPVIYTEVSANNLGLSKTIYSSFHNSIIRYEKLFHKSAILNPFMSIGLHNWIVLTILYISCMTKNKKLLMIVIPLLAIIGTLMIATPIFSEFRYIYSIFTSIYFILFYSITSLNRN